ncbi:TMEM165/GDT1 family protein [Prochlorococcus sp. AH-736-B08]|nr:TMEM165/GDT1 family protein [Prochlorococcus sp. AH-736-B08]
MNSKLEKKENNLEKSFLSIFITTFTTIFIAELGDKTQIATLMLSAESGKPVIVFLGSSLALISSSVVGVLIGKWLSNKISPSKFALFTGALMIFISIFLAYETFKNYL